MNAVYEKNITALSKVNPQLTAYLAEINSEKYHVAKNTSGEAILEIAAGDGKKVAIGDTQSQVGHAQSLIPVMDNVAPLFILMGMGLGTLFFETRKKYPKAIIVVIEADAHIFKKALETFDFTQAIHDPHVSFCVSLKLERLLWELYTFFTEPAHSRATPLLTLIQDNATIKHAYNYYVNAAKIIKQAMDQLWDCFIGNDHKDSFLGAKNVFKNVAHLSGQICIEPHRQMMRDKIGVVVSSGPSLEDKIDWLKKIQDKAVIICSDSSLKKILASGIKPFGVASLERDDEIEDLYNGYEIPDDVVLFYVPQIMPGIVKKFPGPKCFYFRDVFPFSSLPDLAPRLNTGSSCAHLALITLIALGCREIALVGQDLAYDRQSGTSHFSGVSHDTQNFDAKLERVMVPDNQGGEIETHTFWRLYRDQLALIINHNPHVKVYNVIAKESGAKIAGAERVDAAAFFTRFDAVDISKPSIDITLGQKELTQKISDFGHDLTHLKSTMIAELQQLKARYEGLTKAGQFSEFDQMRQTLHAAFSATTIRFFSTYFISILRRFDAAASSIWTTEEFRDHRDEHIKKCQDAMNDLLELLA